jgi:RHS repeat-associated protein
MARWGDNHVMERHDYFPNGEERTPVVGDRNRYGTYHRDQTGLDYADQRYYNSTIGRLLSADPAGVAVPGNNGVLGISNSMASDPVNYTDPIGNREQAVSVEVFDTRREHLDMNGDGSDQWRTSGVCRSHVVYIQIPDIPLPVPQPVPRDVLFKKCVEDAYDYLDKSAKHFRRFRYNQFPKNVADDAIKRGRHSRGCRYPSDLVQRRRTRRSGRLYARISRSRIDGLRVPRRWR